MERIEVRIWPWALARRALVCLALLGWLVVPARAQRQSGGERTASAKDAASERAHFEQVLAEARDPSDLERRLAALGPGSIPFLFQVLVRGGISSAEGSPERKLGGEELAALRRALATRPRREVVSFLETLAAGDPPPRARLAALQLLGASGSREHLRLLARLATPPPDRGPLAPDLREAFESALLAVMTRDPSALAHVRELFQETPAALSSSVVEALARTGTPGVLPALASLLGASPGLDPLILARLAASGRARSDEDVREAVRRYLARGEESLVAAAARTSGELGDDEAVELLIELMDHPSPRVRESVFAALKRLSGLAFGPDAARWTAWYHAEMRWWDEEADLVLLHLERGREVEFTRAARQALEHRLFRDRVAESFAQALRRTDPDEVRLACRALAELRSSAAIPGLIECLERREPGVREAAWKALRAITGAELPPEPESWASLAG